jgi:uncharacterized membrane protein (UPF0136 family)
MTVQEKKQSRPKGIIIASVLMVIFGIAEISTGFRHSFFGISASQSILFTISGVAIGAFYLVAGLLTLTMKRWGAVLAIILLVADIFGRITLVITGLYPINSLENTFSIVAGTVIAGIFALYIFWKWKSALLLKLDSSSSQTFKAQKSSRNASKPLATTLISDTNTSKQLSILSLKR